MRPRGLQTVAIRKIASNPELSTDRRLTPITLFNIGGIELNQSRPSLANGNSCRRAETKRLRARIALTTRALNSLIYMDIISEQGVARTLLMGG
jgi:hypothetical protein